MNKKDQIKETSGIYGFWRIVLGTLVLVAISALFLFLAIKVGAQAPTTTSLHEPWAKIVRPTVGYVNLDCLCGIGKLVQRQTNKKAYDKACPQVPLKVGQEGFVISSHGSIFRSWTQVEIVENTGPNSSQTHRHIVTVWVDDQDNDPEVRPKWYNDNVFRSRYGSGITTPELDTYIVKDGDCLSLVGERLGIPWEEIAYTNRIRPPYDIFVGQILKLPGD